MVKSLTLDEKVEMYNWWKNKDTDWEDDCILMPLEIIQSETLELIPYANN